MKTAMILAAGRGERLRPLTDLCPKALCTIHNTPLIEYHVSRLAQAGFERIIINHAYLGGKIRHYLGDGQRFGVHILYSPEPPGALETGGGILNALPLLGDAPFLTVNADIYTNYSFKSLHLPAASLAHLVLVNTPASHHTSDFGLSNTHHVTNDHKLYTFSGIACYHPRFFDDCVPGRYSVTPLLRAMADNRQISGEIHTDVWFDIGSPERLEYVYEQVFNMLDAP